MKLMWKFLAAMLLCGTAYAQPNPPVFQSGTVTPTHTACWTTTGVIQDCGPGTPVPIPFPLGTLPILSATAFGVKANGVTSDDVALQSAVNACALIGAQLVLPPGQILLTGAATISLRDCGVTGAGAPGATLGVNGSFGTTILLASTTTKPFIAGLNWSISGVNFYWPNQTTGTTPYPALLNCDVACIHWSFDHNVVVNAYDFLTDAPGAGIGSFFVDSNWMYAVHDLIRSAGQGDSFHFSDNQLTSGNWNRITGGANGAALNAASLVNTIFHLTNSTGFAWNITGQGNAMFNWRYGFKLDATALIGLSTFSGTWDGVQTIVDTSSGGNWAYGNTLKGVAGCGGVDVLTNNPRGNAPCFNLGQNGYIIIEHHAGANGTFIKTTGSSVRLLNSGVTAIGLINDGADYYAIDVAGNLGGTIIEVDNTLLSGHPATATLHGIGSSNGTVPSRLSIVGNNFNYFQDPINIAAAPTTVVSSNWSQGTTGSASIILTGTNSVQYGLNHWDKPPLATMGTCGTSPVSHGGMAGFFTTGSGGPTSCAITLPWQPYGNAVCLAMSSAGQSVTTGSPSGAPPTWTFQFSGALSSANVFYNCPGEQ